MSLACRGYVDATADFSRATDNLPVENYDPDSSAGELE